MSREAWWTGWAVVGIVLVAIGFRFYDIQNYPPGLFPDEAANGEDALLILDGDWRPFYPRGNGREGLFFYLEALSIKLFGIGVWQLHVVSAVIGVLSVLATYFATRVWFGRLAGLLAALFLATSHWHVTLSRTGFRAILIPLFIALFTAMVGYMIASVKKRRPVSGYVFAALAGAALAGGFYTYIAYRVMIGVILGVIGLLLLAALHPRIGFPHVKRYGKQMAVAVMAALIVLAPLIIYFVQQPADFVGRAGQVSVFSKDLQAEFGGGRLVPTILYSSKETLMSFFAGEGDLNWRHNVAGYPLLNPLVGVLFLLGVAWALRGVGWVAIKLIKGQEVHLGMIYPYVLLLLVGMLLPVVTTAQALPHALRSIGLVFPIFLLAGTAGAVVVHWYQQKFKGGTLLGIGHGVVIGGLLLILSYDGALYFGVSRNDAEAHYAYRGDLTVVSEYLASQPGGPDMAFPYLVLDGFSLQTPHFLLSAAAHDFRSHPDEVLHRYRAVNPETSHLVSLKAGEIIVFTQSTMVDADRFAELNSAVELVESRVNRFGQEIMRVYRGVDGAVEGIQGEGVEMRYDLDA